MPKNTVEVPKHLPLKIKSLKNAFLYLNSDKVLNLDNWDVSNVNKCEIQCFLMQQNSIKIFQNEILKM